MSIHAAQSIDRVHAISKEDFLNRYGFPGRPVVITGKAGGWRAYERWTFDFFRRRYGSLEVKVRRSGMLDAVRNVALGEYLDSFGSDPGPNPWYLAFWEFGRSCPELREDYEVPEYFTDNWVENVPMDYRPGEWRWLYIGPAGSRSDLHVDVANSSAWNVVISGAKDWLFYPPEQAPYLYDGCVDAYAPDLEECPLFSQASPLHAVTRPGEILFTPSGWWHQAYNLEPCIAVTENFCDETNFREVLAWLRANEMNYGAILNYLMEAREKASEAAR